MEQIIEAIVYFIKYGDLVLQFIMMLLAFLLATGAGAGITSIIQQALGQRYDRQMKALETARIEAIAKLSRDAQMKLLEAYPMVDPDNPDDVEAAKLAERELALLEVKDEEAS
jgi:hypothetical protein